MRAIGLATIAIQIGLIIPAHAENTGDPDRSITDVLPLFVKNRYHDFASSFGLLDANLGNGRTSPAFAK